jgi:hypothetical protein
VGKEIEGVWVHKRKDCEDTEQKCVKKLLKGSENNMDKIAS